jgi:type II secretory pathway component PulF
MPNFSYIVKDAKGARVEGMIKADTLDMAVDKLSKEGNTIIAVKAAAEGAYKGKLSLFDKLMLTIYKIRTGVSLKTLVFFTRQLSTMFSAGLTIEKAISDLEKMEKNAKFAKVLRKISDDIRKGFSLSEAMEQHPVSSIRSMSLWSKPVKFPVPCTQCLMSCPIIWKRLKIHSAM